MVDRTLDRGALINVFGHGPISPWAQSSNQQIQGYPQLRDTSFGTPCGRHAASTGGQPAGLARPCMLLAYVPNVHHPAAIINYAANDGKV